MGKESNALNETTLSFVNKKREEEKKKLPVDFHGK